MFLEFYKLREQPFGVTPDPRYLHLSPTHREALASIVYGIEARRGFMALIAKPGMGKTTLLFHLLQSLEGSARTILIFQTQCTPRDFLRTLATDVGIEEADDDLVRMQSKLNELLFRESQAGRGVVLIVDEAQNLDPSVLEVLRMLSNFETPREKLMQIVLVGQPQLADKLKAPGLLQLRQRVSILSHLDPFTPEETYQYIDHRLRVAGYDFKAPLFTCGALTMISDHAEGIPRNINNICFHALSLGCVLKQQTIDRKVVQEVLRDLSFESLEAQPIPPVRSEEDVRPGVHETVSARSTLRRWILRAAVAGALLVVSAQSIHDMHRQATKPSVSAVAAVPTPQSGEPTQPAESTSIGDRNPGGASVSPILDPLAPKGNPSDSLAIMQPLLLEPAAEIPVPDLRAVRVSQRQTLYEICMKSFGKFRSETIRRILELNPWLTSPQALRPGDVILIPPAKDFDPARSAAPQSADTLPGETVEP